MGVLSDITVVDFSTLLPGPLATLMLASAGAKVVKIERPPDGDEMRSYAPTFGGTSANYALLNSGKETVMADLRSQADAEHVWNLVRNADVLVEQFRPGVMGRLGLGYEQVSAVNSHLIYCSITGYGQTGPYRLVAGHDLNYLAETGMLSLTVDRNGAPSLPPALIADIGGGAYPAIINILLALERRRQTGRGMHLDISMADNLFTWMYWGLGSGFAKSEWPQPGRELTTGGSPRYGVYRAQDGKYVAVAALEDRFWNRFGVLLGLSPEELDDRRMPDEVRKRVQAAIGARPSSDWSRVFADEDVCCSVVKTLAEAAHDKHFADRGVFEGRIQGGSDNMPLLHIPIAKEFGR